MRMILTAAVALMLCIHTAPAQIPDKFENLQVLARDISRGELVGVMRGFASDLGVRCVYCHVAPAGSNPNTLEGIDFKSDDKIQKEKARRMLEMVKTINATLLPDVPERITPPVQVQCATCHRRSPLPKLLDRVLADALETEGVDSAIARYRQLREQTMVEGRYNFAEPTLNQLAESLAQRGKTAEALRFLELNLEFNPGSAQIEYLFGEVHHMRGEQDLAVARLKRALEKMPRHQQAARRLKELEG